MTGHRASRGGLRRLPLLLGVVLLAVLTNVTRAGAVGVADVELRLELSRVEGRLTVEVGDGPTTLPILLENVGSEPTVVRLSVAGVSVDDNDNATLGTPDGAAFVEVPADPITVDAGATVPVDGSIEPTRLPSGQDETYAAILIEAEGGDTLVLRAAQVFRIVGEREPLLTGPVIVAAVAVVLLTALFVGRELRIRRRREDLMAT